MGSIRMLCTTAGVYLCLLVHNELPQTTHYFRRSSVQESNVQVCSLPHNWQHFKRPGSACASYCSTDTVTHYGSVPCVYHVWAVPDSHSHTDRGVSETSSKAYSALNVQEMPKG